jgi:hypothetical protein
VNPSAFIQAPTNQKESFRNTTLWYPHIPKYELHLNEGSFTGVDPAISSYQPLFWTIFGGPKGTLLRHLREISFIYRDSLCSIKFHYDVDDIPSTYSTLGRFAVNEYTRVIHFKINGAGGETIKTLETSVDYTISQHGILSSLKVMKIQSACL